MLLRTGLLVLGAQTLYLIGLLIVTPSVSHLTENSDATPSVVLDRNGEEVALLQAGPGYWVTLDEVSPNVVNALLATEDRRFYRHAGIDVRRTVSSLFETIRGNRQGGSTITQQLARNRFPNRIGRSATIHRKLKEAITAFKIEAVYSKAEILEIYLNTVPFLYNATGIEMAALTYYGKPSRHLDPAESATLVGMLKGTSYYNPVRNPERSKARRDVVLRLMYDQGFIDTTAFAQAQAQTLGLAFRRLDPVANEAPHFVAYVRDLVNDWAVANGHDLLRDGLRIHTTLDLELQRKANVAVTRQLQRLQAVADVEWSAEKTPLSGGRSKHYVEPARSVDRFGYFMQAQSAVVDSWIERTPRYASLVRSGVSKSNALKRVRANAAAMDSLRARRTRLETGFVAIQPESGHVRAWVGSRDYGKNQYDHVAVAKRQPGSTFKAFLYATALEKGYRPYDRVSDRPISINLRDGSTWKPANSGSTAGRMVTVRDALTYSKNTVAARLVDDLGARNVARQARAMGINRSKLEPVPSLALGTSEVTLLEMVSGYATIASQGTYHTPVLVTSVEDAGGITLVRSTPRSDRVLSRRSAGELTDMLRDVVDKGTGRAIRTPFGISGDLAGKTGTTQDNADGWFILMHPDLVAGAWVGFDDRRVTFRSDYWGQGARNALWVVGDFYQQSLAGRSPTLDPKARFNIYRDPFDRSNRWRLVRNDDNGRSTSEIDRALATLFRDLERAVENRRARRARR